VLADFMTGGHFERHLRRMRAAYRERLEAMTMAAERFCGDTITLRPIRTGLHAVADLHGVDASAVFREAAAREVEVMPVSAYFAGRVKDPMHANALVLGFASLPPDALIVAMRRLAAAIEGAAIEAAASDTAARSESSAVRRRAVAGRR
jgi:GntR family transcriptional regulator/MocR family aminotransferase